MAKFVIIDHWNDTINLVTDSEGNTKVYGSPEEAFKDLEDCQEGTLVML